MSLILAILTVHVAAFVGFAAWAARTIRRLRISVNLAHDDLADIRAGQRFAGLEG